MSDASTYIEGVKARHPEGPMAMLAAAREQARATPKPWWAKEPRRRLIRWAIEEAGWVGEVAPEAVVDMVSEVYTVKDFFGPCLQGGADAYAMMVKQLRAVVPRRKRA